MTDKHISNTPADPKPSVTKAAWIEFWPAVVLALLTAAFTSLASHLIWGREHDVQRQDALYEQKAQMLERLAEDFNKYAYLGGFRSLLHFEKVELNRSLYGATTFDSLVRSDLSLDRRFAIQDTLKRRRPMMYDLMMQGDIEAVPVIRDLLVIQVLYDDAEITYFCDSLKRFVPADNLIYEYSTRMGKGPFLEENDKNACLQWLKESQESTFGSLLTLMAAQLRRDEAED